MDGELAMDGWRHSPSHYDVMTKWPMTHFGCYYNENLRVHHAFCWFANDQKIKECVPNCKQ